MANRYVNTASTAGGDGTTNATTGANRAWADLAEAANALGASLSTPIDIYCEGSAADTSNVDQTVWDFTTTATNKLRIIGEQSPLHPNFSTAKSGQYDTSLYHITCTNRNGLYNNIPGHVEYHGIQVHVTVTNASSYVVFKTTNANQNDTDITCVMSHCIAKATETSGTVIGFHTRFPGTGGRGTSKVRTCLSIDCDTGFANDFGLSGDVGEFYNCTAAGATYSYVEDATMKVVNCLSTAAAIIGFVGTFAAGSNYNAEDDGNGAPGANSRSNQTFTFVDAANDDFHLASTDAGAKGFGLADPDSGAFSDDVDGQTRGATWDIGFDQYFPPAIEQEGFRWGVDDGAESAHTWEAAQDTNITVADNQARLLRVLVNTPEDPGAQAFTLRAQKNGTGGYAVVGVGSTTDVTPTPDSGDATESGNNTASTSWALSVPNASTNDLLIFCISWDDSTACTDVTEPSGQNSETLSEVNATPATDSGTETRCKVWYCKCTGAWTAGTITFTPAASEQWTGACIRIPAGEFDSTTPIGASGTSNSTADGANIQHAAFSAGGSDGGGRLCVWTSADTDPQTVASGFTAIANEDRGAVSGGFFTRDTVVTDSESFSATTVSTIASDSWCTVAFVIRPHVVNNEVYITTSANITAGGEATTARLTAPSGKTTSDFVTGRRWDDENGTDTIDLTSNDYTEVEWLVALSSAPVDTDYFEFRVYAGGAALTTYTLTPKWTVGSGGTIVAIGQATETDLAQTLTKRKVKALSQAVETDLAQTLTKRKVKVIGQATETDLAQALTRVKVKTLGQMVETDLAQALSRSKVRVLGQAVETDLAQPIASSSQQIIPVGLVVETDLAQALAKRKVKALGQALETDLAQPLTKLKRKALGQAVETDLAQALTKRKVKALGQALETDLAQALARVKARVLGQTVETDLAQPIATSGSKIVPVGQVVETDTAQPLTKRKVKALGQALETDLAQTLTRVKAKALGQTLETDLAQALTKRKAKALGQTVETDLAQPITKTGSKIVPLGQVVETDLAQPLTKRKVKAIGLPIETDLAQALSRSKARWLGQAVETDLAQAVRWSPQIRMVGQAVETDLAIELTVRQGELVARVVRLSVGMRPSVELDLEVATTVRLDGEL